jgi:hypothetical protein
LSWINSLRQAFGGKRFTVTRDRAGNVQYLTDSDSFSSGYDELELALSNPALFSTLDYRASLFSQGLFFVEDLEGNDLGGDPILDRLSNPNYAESKEDFLYKVNFFKGTGNCLVRNISRGKDNTNIDNVISFEALVPNQINYKDINKDKTFLFAKSDIKKIKEETIEYNENGESTKIALSELMFFYDIANGLTSESRFMSPSRIKALIPTLRNIEQAQSSKNINLKMSAKHIISSSIQAGSMREGLGEKEQREIENKTFHKDLIASNSDLNVNSLANNMKQLMYDDGIASDFLKVLTAYGFDGEVLKYFSNSASTHENKTAGTINAIQGVIQNQADDFCNTLNNQFGYYEQGKKLVMKFDHFPAMQTLKAKKMEMLSRKIEIAKGLVDLGLTNEQALKQTGLNELSNEK